MALLQKPFCVLFISLALIFYFLQTRKEFPYNIMMKFVSKGNSGDIFRSLNGFSNLSLRDPRERFDILKFLKSSLLDGETESSLQANEIENVYILGLFELTTKHGRRKQGESELMAARMAVQHVNALNIFNGYKLVLLVNDTQCDPGVAIDRLFHTIYSNKTIVMLLGAGCSNVSEALAHIVPYWNIIQVSYGSKSPTLSDRKKFPLFFRTVAPDSSHNIAKRHFIKRHAWQVVVAFSQSENRYLLPVNYLITELERDNVTCVSTVTFSLDNYKEQLGVLKGLDIRIIVGSFSVGMAPLIFCKAFELGIYGSEYLWILENHDTPWWHDPPHPCEQISLETAVEGAIMVGDYDFTESEDYNTNFSSRYAKQSYDAIWTMALTLGRFDNEFITEFDYGKNEVALKFFEVMKELRFVGLSGPIRFNGADRIGDFVVSQVQGGTLRNVALYDSIKDKLEFDCHICNKIRWKDGQVPIAQRILKTTLLTIPRSLFYLTSGISSLGIICSFLFLYFNLKFRQMKNVKLSSPNINNLTVIGCILVYLSVIIFAYHSFSKNTESSLDQLCLIRIYFLSAGFSLTFGSISAKSYRVHRLFTYSTTASLVRNKLLQDQQLIGLILIPPLIDTLIVGLWVTVDPLRRNLHDLVLEINQGDPRVVYRPQIELCECHNTVGWHIALFGYKSILLLTGVFMAWKTRHVKIQALNDSQYIGMCVYSAVFSTVIVIVFSLVTEYFILSFIAKTGSILVSTSITLALLLLPKLKSTFRRVDHELSIMESMGLKIQYNTRRFILEDPRELLCRLEIQNKAYKSELESLDREISRLEGILARSEKSSCNTIQTIPEVHNYLSVPRGSWPTWQNQSIQTCSSESGDLLGKFKRLFGSLASLQYSGLGNRSNPEIDADKFLVPYGSNLGGKVGSDGCIRQSYY